MCRFSHVIAHRCNQHGDDRKCPIDPRVRGTFTLKIVERFRSRASLLRTSLARPRRTRLEQDPSNAEAVVRTRTSDNDLRDNETRSRSRRARRKRAWLGFGYTARPSGVGSLNLYPIASEGDKREPAEPKHSTRAAIQASYRINRPLQLHKSPCRCAAFSNISRGLV